MEQNLLYIQQIENQKNYVILHLANKEKEHVRQITDYKAEI